MNKPTVKGSTFAPLLEELLHKKPRFTVKPLKRTKDDKEKAKMVQYIINHHFKDDKNVVAFNEALCEKFKEYANHYMTCTDSEHMHDVEHTHWGKKNEL